MQSINNKDTVLLVNYHFSSFAVQETVELEKIAGIQKTEFVFILSISIYKFLVLLKTGTP